jgi:protein phosphatase
LGLFKKWFHKEKEATKEAAEEIKTAPLNDDQLNTVSSRPVKAKPSHLLVGVGQSVGRQRDHNEDTLFALSSVLSDGNNEIPFGFFLIADGMGGYEYGEVASSVTARIMSEQVITKLFLPLVGLDNHPPAESVQEIMESGVVKAQQAVLRRAPGGGTTLTAALIIGDQMTITHVGDSRAYFIYPDGRMETLTQDHSLVRRLVDLGQITDEEAAVHPQRNVLYRALGQAEPFRPDIQSMQIPHPVYLLLCSDGLWGVVKESEIFQIVRSARNPSVACKNLVDSANEGGGPDNISVVLVQYL